MVKNGADCDASSIDRILYRENYRGESGELWSTIQAGRQSRLLNINHELYLT